MSQSNTPLSYKDAGVDIVAGDALIERIKPLAKKTMRAGSNAPATLDGKPFKQATTEPTRPYVKNVLAALAEQPIKGMAAHLKKAAGRRPSCLPGCKRLPASTTPR